MSFTNEEKYKSILVSMNQLVVHKPVLFKFSDILLFREYQTRLFQWNKEVDLNCLDYFNKNKRYHNLFRHLFDNWETKIIPFAQVLNDLVNLGVPHISYSIRDYQGYLLSLYINWEILKNDPSILKYTSLKHPYEPIYKMCLRGGVIQEDGNKYVIDYTKTYLRYDNQFTMPSIENDFLNFMDINCTDFPNQEKVNQLWNVFQIKESKIS